jgi:subtilisin family serine protease
MTVQEEISGNAHFDFYAGHYARFDGKLAAEVGREVYGEDLGQTGWRTAAEQAEIRHYLRLGPDGTVLDIACGAGGPSLALVERTGCQITGVDIEPTGIEHPVPGDGTGCNAEVHEPHGASPTSRTGGEQRVSHASTTRRSAAAAALAIVATLLVGCTGPATPAFPAPSPGIVGAGSGAAIPGRYIVVLKDTASLRAVGVAARARALTVQHQGRLSSVYERTLSGFSVVMSEAAAKRLAADPEVAWVEQDQVVHVEDTQENPPSTGLDRIDQRALPLDTSYSYDAGPSPVTAYVLDTGIRISHSDFGGRASNGWDFIDDDTIANDCNGHGTHVAGTLGGTQFGVAKNVRLVAVRAFNCSGTSTMSSILSAVEFIRVVALRPAVANLSIGIDCVDASGNPAPCPLDTGKAIKTAIENSITSGISYVVAAGNQNIDACGDPFSQIATAISVGAVDTNDAKQASSNWGGCVDLWGPGQNIVSAGIATDTATHTDSGTSMAAPHVTAALALMLTRPGFATKTPVELKAQVLQETTAGAITGLDPSSKNKLLYVPAPPVAGGSSIALPRHGDGRLMLFGVNSTGTLFYRSQAQANSGTWSGWTSSVTPNWYSVCADTDSLPHIKLVGLRRNQEIWHRSQAFSNGDSWSLWQRFDGLLNSCAVAFNGTKLEVFGTNTQGQVWRRSEVTPGGGIYTPWAPIGGVQVLRSVAAERNGNGLVELFGLTRTGQIWHCWDTASNCGPPGSWVQLDGQLSTIALARNGIGTLSVFGVNAAGQLFRRDAASGTNNWFSWSQMDVPPAGGTLRSVAAETNADGRIALVAVNTAGQVWQRTQTAAGASTYGPWAQLDGLLRP